MQTSAMNLKGYDKCYDAKLKVSYNVYHFYQPYHHQKGSQQSTITKYIPFLNCIFTSNKQGFIACQELHTVIRKNFRRNFPCILKRLYTI